MRRLITCSLVLLLAACGGGPATPPTETVSTTVPAATLKPVATAKPLATRTPRPTVVPTETVEVIEITSATYAEALDENQGPIDPTDSFRPEDTIYLSLSFDGVPKTGVVNAAFYWRDTLIAESSIDFAESNDGVVFSIGQNSQIGFNLTHVAPLYVSEQYRTEVSIDGEPVGEYPFTVIPAAGAIPSQIDTLELARGTTDNFDPIEPATVFAPDDAIFVVGTGDLGAASYIDIAWYINGELLDSASSPLTSTEDADDIGFYFCLRPGEGWKPGDHEVRVTLDDTLHGTYPFTIDPDQAAIESTPECKTPDTSVNFDSPQTFAWPNNLFQIDIPANWVAGDQGIENGTLTARWADANEQVQIIVLLYEDTSGGDMPTIINDAATLVTDTFGDRSGFVAADPAEQSDGSTLLSWRYLDSESGDARLLRGTLYVELRENIVSYLFVTTPDDRYDTLWDSGLSDLVNSYRIDPTQPIE